jgi:hypothetical protein
VRRALITIACAAALLPLGCGGDGDSDGDGSRDLAAGKLFDPADVTRCLRAQGFGAVPNRTDTGVDFTVHRRDGRNTIDVGVEQTAAAAADLEKEWRELADQAAIENPSAYYFRYGNLMLGYERVPSAEFRRKVERCLS